MEKKKHFTTQTEKVNKANHSNEYTSQKNYPKKHLKTVLDIVPRNTN